MKKTKAPSPNAAQDSKSKKAQHEKANTGQALELRLLAALLDSAPDYIYFKDAKSRFIRTSRAHAGAFGLTDPAEVVGKTDFDFFTEDHARPAFEDEQQVMRTEESLSREEKETWPDRPDTWVLTTKMPLRDADGKVIGTFGISKDITEQKRAELELQREKLFLEALILNSPVAIVVLDGEGNMLSGNPAFEQLFGYASDEIVGKSLDALIATEETITGAEAYTVQAMAGPIHGFGKRRRKDGTLVSVEIFGVPVVLAGGGAGALAIYHDITELDQAQKAAEEANRAKSEFLANMSHEIRTPMNGVIGMLELALDTSLTGEQRDYLGISLQSAETLLALINDILDFSKIEAQKLEIDSIDFDLRNTVEDVAFMLAKRAQDKGLEMVCLIHPELNGGLKGDPGRLRQILVNLAGNAIKFTAQGEIVIRADPIEDTPTHAGVRFSVQDTGIGIPQERLAAVFDRFTQADGSTTRRYGGTGLGLTISKQLVEAMGGQIGVESQPGYGSTFWFTVNLEKQAGEQIKPDLSLPSELSMDVSDLRVLCIDDNATNRMILTKLVEGFGCRIDSVASGAKALETMRRARQQGDPYRLVLLDMQMPGMDGEQTAREIKSDPSIRDTHILILTSMGQRGDAARLEALGCDAYLLKPIKQQLLYDTLRTVLVPREEKRPGLVTRHSIAEHKRHGLRILLAEDNLINQKLAVILLQKAGYSVDAVENGARAVEKVESEHYSAVLMDVQMPELDGFEATRRIRAWEAGASHVPIIAMTAHALKGDRERCIDAGMDDYVSKPLEPQVLFNALDRWTAPEGSTKAAESDDETQDYNSPPTAPALAEDGLFGEAAPQAALQTGLLPEKSAVVIPAGEMPLDVAAALPRFGDDRAFFNQMCREFLDHLPARLDEMQAALAAGDVNGLGRLAHNLKGVSANFSAGPVTRLAAEIEKLGMHEDVAGAPELLEQLGTETDRLAGFCAELKI